RPRQPRRRLQPRHGRGSVRFRHKTSPLRYRIAGGMPDTLACLGCDEAMAEPHNRKMTASETNPGPAAIAVLPLGASEQHGPHLPFETDTIIAQGVAARAKALLPDGLEVEFLPAEPIGYSPEHMHVAGSRTLAYDEAVNRWIGIGEQCL